MAAQRLSKLQKWILVNCYNVTILKERKDKALARCFHYNSFTTCSDKVTPFLNNPNVLKCKSNSHYCSAYTFTQMDIYFYYYGLQSSKERQAYSNQGIYFIHTPESDKIYQTTSRSLKNLRDKGLIQYIRWEGISAVHLTDIGKATAEKLKELSL
jgi:hypothetical protein